MSSGTRARVMILAAGIVQMGTGCDQNTPDYLDFALPTARFFVQSGPPQNRTAQWREAPPDGVPNLVCAGPLATITDCCSPPSRSTPIDCQRYPVVCDDIDNFCALTFDVEIVADANLLSDVGAVAAADGRSFFDVALLELDSRLKIDKGDNLPIRSAKLFIGPRGLTSSSSPEARLVAELPVDGSTSGIVPPATGQAAFSRFARDYRTPFVWLLQVHIVVLTGTDPEVEVTFFLSGTARARY